MSRQLWLLRHGEAEPHGIRPDADRELTAKGRRQSLNAGRALRRLGIEFEAVYASPRVRALDTARLACGELGVDVAVHEPLGGGFERSAAAGLLDECSGDGRLLLVGHEPDFSQLAYDFTGGRIDLKKGGIAAIRAAPGELLVVLRPREIELLATEG
ncbi:MAG TPA: phosphoglycerate mutase family protein [Solirubrobacteraceae bacterium]|jgi:phosphohistidine phosphatase|nr:phosphoglycerate mutase family protein [Solirubrobacteraceae bacterium]